MRLFPWQRDDARWILVHGFARQASSERSGSWTSDKQLPGYANVVGTTRTFAARKLRNSLVAERRLSRSILRRCLASRYRKKCADANRGCVCNSQRDSSTDILTRSSISFVLLIRSTTPPSFPSISPTYFSIWFVSIKRNAILDYVSLIVGGVSISLRIYLLQIIVQLCRSFLFLFSFLPIRRNQLDNE